MEAGSNKGPSLFQIEFRARQLEVVNIDDEEELQERVEVTRRPLLRNGLKTNRDNVLVTVFLPKGATIRVSIQRLFKATTGFRNLLHEAGRSSGGRQTQVSVPSRTA